MRFARLIAAAIVVVAVAAGGVFVFAPEVLGQSKRVIVSSDPEVEVFGMGGSRIGVAVRDVDQADVTREKLAGPSGAVVEEVRSETPAAKAGLKSGDVIVSFDGERVRSARQLERLVEETPAGRTVKLAVQRAGSKVELDVTPEAPANALFRGGEFKFPEAEALTQVWPRVERDFKRRFPANEFSWDGRGFGMAIPQRGRLGVQVQDLSDQLAGYFGVKSGVLVTDVDDGSPAAKAGVKAGDVITAVNGQTVMAPDELRHEMSKVEEGKPADLAVTRDKKPLNLKVETEPSPGKVERRVRRTV
jgi:serine protease Do